MSVASGTATGLVHRIFDLQRVLRCIVSSNISRDAQVGFALQGVLRFIGEGESRATNLAARLGVSPPVLSRHIAELEELGLVVRRPDPADGRAQLVALSEEGLQQVRDFEEHRSARLRDYLAEWSEEDALEAARVLGKLTDSLSRSVREQHSSRAKAAGSAATNDTTEEAARLAEATA
ncbi:transcriptional regulator [Arthrobacter sp. SW1]|uniref:MarR family winged helix-turn-helix transcriptional regulator n=1 Tax=Arthrobacter sp. SW1 TaxID=1920889 RepID=UPI000877CEDB|nr:MarR family transcriptional regulator [Arthrobacter sp. SW1]OFI37614.1 transcriptional regulator [Arthrobacter sp. SW1]